MKQNLKNQKEIKIIYKIIKSEEDNNIRLFGEHFCKKKQ